MKNKLQVIAVHLFVFLFLENVVAAEMPATDEEMLFMEIPTIITAARKEQPLTDAPASIIVITENQLKDCGARTISDVLKTVQGVYTLPSERHIQKLYVRGIGSIDTSYNDKVLLMVDGIPYRDIFYGHASIDEYLPLENIKRIEIVTGPGSALYGTNAFGGVINVLTKSVNDVNGTEASFGFGSADTKLYSIIHGQNSVSPKILVFARKYTTKGDGPEYSYNHKLESLQEDPADASAIQIKTSYNDFTLNLKYIDFRHTYTTNPDIPETAWDRNYFNYKNYFLDAGYEKKLSDSIKFLVKTWWHYYDNLNFWQKTEPKITTFTVITSDMWCYKESQIAAIESQMNIGWPSANQDIIIGGQYDYEEIVRVEDLEIYRATGIRRDPSEYWMNPMNRNNAAVYFQDIYKPVDFIDITGGIRTDVHQVFGNSTNPRCGFVLRPLDRTTLKLLYGSAFRAPDYRQRYVKTGDWTIGNEKLKPEHIETPEVELSYDFTKRITSKINFYKSRITDMIETQSVPGGKKYVNSENSLDVQGFEYAVKFFYRMFDAYINYSYNETRDHLTEELLYGRPVNMANGGITYKVIENLRLNSTLSYVGEIKRSDEDKNDYDPKYTLGEKRPDLPGYFNLNLTGIVTSGNIEISCSVYNIFNQKQFVLDESPSNFDVELPGRNVLVKASYKF